MKGGPAPHPAQQPAPGPMPGPMPGAMPGQNTMNKGSGIDLSKAMGPEQQNEKKLATIVARIMASLKKMGYYDLPENKNRGEEIAKEIEEVARAIIDNKPEILKQSKIYKYITALGGQRQAMQEPESTRRGGFDGTQG